MSLVINPFTLAPTAWYVADDLTLQDADKVDVWADHSGNGRHLSQSNDSQRPRVYNNGRGGHRYLVFDGTDDFMASSVNATSFFGTGGQGTVLAVYAHPDAQVNAASPIWSVYNATNLASWMTYDLAISPDALRCAYEQSSGSYVIADRQIQRNKFAISVGVQAPNALHVLMWQHYRASASSHAIRAAIDNLDTVAWSVTGGTADDPYLGNAVIVGSHGQVGQYMYGNLYELIFFNTVLTEAQLRGVQLYLTERYGIEYLSGMPAGEAVVPSYRVEMKLPTTTLQISTRQDEGRLRTQQAALRGSPLVPPRMWLKADDMGVVLQNNDPVTYWYNRSPNYLTERFEQTEVANKPIFKINVTVGMPAVQFNGADHFMQITSVQRFFGIRGRGTVIAAINLTPRGANSAHVLWGSGDSEQSLLQYVGENVTGPVYTLSCYTNTGAGAATASKVMAANTWGVTLWEHEVLPVEHGAAIVAGWNKMKYADTAGTSIGDTQDLGGVLLYLGQDWYTQRFKGYIAEIMFFDYELDSAARQHVLAYLTYKYGITYPYGSEAYQSVWQDVTKDVRAREPIQFSYGIGGSDFNDRVAGVGKLQLTMRNDIGNSANLVGYYSPGHITCRSGWGLNVPVRVVMSYYGTDYYKWVGRITDIKPVPGKEDYGVHVMAADYMDEIRRMAFPQQMAVQFNKTARDLFSTIILNIPKLPPSWDFDDGTVTFPFIFDSSEDEDINTLTELARAIASEQGYCFVRGNADYGSELVFHNANHRGVYPSVVHWNMAKSVEMDPVHGMDLIVNRTIVRVYPRAVGTTPEVVFTLGAKYHITGAEPALIFTAPFRGDSSGRARRVGVKDPITPVAGTDYYFAQNEDGSGANRTSQLQVTVTFGANSAIVSIFNNSVNDGYLTLFQLRATALYTFESIAVDRKDTASIAAYGESQKQYDLPYVGDSRVAKTIADAIILKFKDPHTWVRQVGFLADESASMMNTVAREPGDRVQITESTSGLNSSLYHVHGIQIELGSDRIVKTTWLLAPA